MFGMYGVITVHKRNRTFSVNGARLGAKKPHGLLSNTMAVLSAGTSRIAEKAMSDVSKLAVSTMSFSFDELTGYDVDVDNDTVMSGGIGRAVVGDLLAGPVGAIVGATTRKSKSMCNSMTLIIHLNNQKHPLITVSLIEKPVKRSSSEYAKAVAKAQESIAGLDLIANGGFDK